MKLVEISERERPGFGTHPGGLDDKKPSAPVLKEGLGGRPEILIFSVSHRL